MQQPPQTQVVGRRPRFASGGLYLTAALLNADVSPQFRTRVNFDWVPTPVSMAARPIWRRWGNAFVGRVPSSTEGPKKCLARARRRGKEL